MNAAMRQLRRPVPSVLLLVLLALGAWRCGDDAGTAPETGPVVATVGEREIDWNHVWRSYHLRPMWGRGLTRAEAFGNQLAFLVEEKLFAQEAARHGADTTADLAGFIDFIEDKEVIKELYRREVEATVEIGEAELQQAYQWSKRHVTLDFVLTPDPGRALAYRDSLTRMPAAEITLAQPGPEEKGTTPSYSFGDMRPQVEAVVFDLDSGAVAGPIEVDGRYMVVKVVGGYVDAFQSEQDYAEAKSKLDRIIRERKTRVLSDAYIADMMAPVDVSIERDAFVMLARQFNQVVQAKTSDNPIPVYLDNRELRTVEGNLADLMSAPLATFDGRTLTIGDFLTHLFNMPASLRPQVNMVPALQRAVGVTVRNIYLAERARAQGLDEAPAVRREVRIQTDEALATWYKNRIRAGLSVDAAEIDSFRASDDMTELKNSYAGEITDELIRAGLSDRKYARARLALVDSLSTVFAVSVDSSAFLGQIENPDQEIDENPVRVFYKERFE